MTTHKDAVEEAVAAHARGCTVDCRNKGNTLLFLFLRCGFGLGRWGVAEVVGAALACQQRGPV